jgi:hypothetical protein
MELILNLCWLMLVLPAYWLWRRNAERALWRKFGSLRSALVLTCILMLLFPVVSATDDLHFIRPEMEESGPSRRASKHVGSDRAFSIRHYVPELLEATTVVRLAPAAQILGQVLISELCIASAVLSSSRPGRAPPQFLLAYCMSTLPSAA